MARKLPWAGNSEPAPKRSRHQSKLNPQAQTSPDGRGRPHSRQTQIKMSPSTPQKRRTGSRTPSTSPPPGPPDVEAMREGYDEDDIWMMVEDEFDSLARTFTSHLHHAEYKRLMKKAREAPRKELPDPQSPMSKETKRKLQRGALDKQQQDALGRIGARIDNDPVDAEEDKVDDPWRGTALAGLIALGSQERPSLIGLEKMPSSTRAAQGFSKAEAARPRKVDAIDLLTRPPEQRSALGAKQKRPMNQSTNNELEDQGDSFRRAPRRSPAIETSMDNERQAFTEDPEFRESSQRELPSTFSVRGVAERVSVATTGPLSKPSSLLKRKKAKEENKEDRLAEVPMFLI